MRRTRQQDKTRVSDWAQPQRPTGMTGLAVPHRSRSVLLGYRAAVALRGVRRVSTQVATLTAALILLAALAPAHMPGGGGPNDQPGPVICGQPILNSPWNYNAASGSYTSGTAGLPTFGGPSTDFPNATAGDVLPPQTMDYPAFDLNPDTVYYLEPGAHVGQFQAKTGDVFVGGYAGGSGAVITDNYAGEHYAIDSNSPDGNQPGVTIEYLTIEEFEPFEDQTAVDPSGNTGWTVKYNTITLNVAGGGVQGTAGDDIEYNCLTQNGQYGINASQVNNFGVDTLTGGPYGIIIEHNEISYNDTCDEEGLLTNTAAGFTNYNPVPPQYRNPHCTDQQTPFNNGNWGGFKLWHTDAVLVEYNWIHNNFGVGGWVDSDNANTTWAGNWITNNDYEGIIEEISYNFSITGNVFNDNDWIGGLGNAGFPQPAIYVSESGSDTLFGGVPACPEAACSGFPSYSSQSVISGNSFTDNGGGIFEWENADRYCSSGVDSDCTLVDSQFFTISNCAANFPSATVNTTTFAGNITGSPAEDWWDGCQWETGGIAVTGNTITNNPAHIPYCNAVAWPACGANGIFSNYSNPIAGAPAWAVGSMITFYRGDTWTGNQYYGPPNFYAWQQGNTVTPAQWTGPLANGDKCTSGSETVSARCTGPFQFDAGAVFGPLGGPSGPTGYTPFPGRRTVVTGSRGGR